MVGEVILFARLRPSADLTHVRADNVYNVAYDISQYIQVIGAVPEGR